MNKFSCKTCTYWQPMHDENRTDDWQVGLCKRHAPIILLKIHSDYLAEWPHTQGMDFCGDWSKYESNKETA